MRTMLFIAILIAVGIAATGCTRIALPGGATYVNVLQNKSYDLTYTDPETGAVLHAQINVSNDPAMKALSVAETAIGLAKAAQGAPVP